MFEKMTRPRLLGLYFQFKAAVWASVGIAAGWGMFRSGEMAVPDMMRFLAFYLILFMVPAILIWILGIAVKNRFPSAWWFAVAYLAIVMISKLSSLESDFPQRVWSWTQSGLPPFYLEGLKFFGVFMTIVTATDIAALASFISPPGRACFHIGNPTREAKVENVDTDITARKPE